MKKEFIEGGQGRTSEDIQHDAWAFCWIVLAAVMLIVSSTVRAWM